MKYPNRLREAREAKGLSQSDVASAIGKLQPSYQRYEAGNQDLKADMIRDLCKLLECSADWLLCAEQRTGNNPPQNDGERELLGYFRDADVRGRRAIIRAAKDICSLQAPDKSNRDERMENTA